MNTLFAVGFPRETDEIKLNELFSQYGLVRTLTIIRDQHTGESKGYAFVHMLDLAGAERVIKHLNGTRIGERTLTVRYADEKHQKPLSQRSGLPMQHRGAVKEVGNRKKRTRLGGQQT